MQINRHLYFFIHNKHESELCKLESKYIFDEEEKNKLLFSDIKFEPSHSAFIKQRLDILASSNDYFSLLEKIKNEKININNFKIEYFVLDGDTTNYGQRLEKLKDIGYCIDGEPEYYKPTITYGLCHHNGIWYFGETIKNGYDWHKHRQKPYSFSNSININIAKALVNIATKTDKNIKLLDACCGAGTIMLEACFCEYNIEGCDINWKVCQKTRANLAHFGYTSTVYRCDIKDITNKYDAAIIDLPYNIFSSADDNSFSHIIESTAKITNHLVIVSVSDITHLIHKAGLTISDSCSVGKSGKVTFSRKIWVCKK